MDQTILLLLSTVASHPCTVVHYSARAVKVYVYSCYVLGAKPEWFPDYSSYFIKALPWELWTSI